MTGSEILNLPMKKNDAKAKTVKDYLRALLSKLWADGESFGGKRPFGNSGWEHDLYQPLLAAGLVKGEIDSDGYIETIDSKAADKLIFEAIAAL